MRTILMILTIIGVCFAGYEWVDGYRDDNGKWIPGHYVYRYDPPKTNYREYQPKKYDPNDYQPKTEYVKPYVKKDGKFVNGYWRSKRDD